MSLVNPESTLSLKIKKEETEIISPGRRLLENVQAGLQEDIVSIDNNCHLKNIRVSKEEKFLRIPYRLYSDSWCVFKTLFNQ